MKLSSVKALFVVDAIGAAGVSLILLFPALWVELFGVGHWIVEMSVLGALVASWFLTTLIVGSTIMARVLLHNPIYNAAIRENPFLSALVIWEMVDA